MAESLRVYHLLLCKSSQEMPDIGGRPNACYLASSQFLLIQFFYPHSSESCFFWWLFCFWAPGRRRPLQLSEMRWNSLFKINNKAKYYFSSKSNVSSTHSSQRESKLWRSKSSQGGFLPCKKNPILFTLQEHKLQKRMYFRSAGQRNFMTPICGLLI